jgi:hypothetical protein
LVGSQYDQILKQLEPVLAEIQNHLTTVASQSTKHEKFQKVIAAAKSLFTRVQFISSTLTMVSAHFNFTMPLHHLFLAITTMDFSDYLEILRDWMLRQETSKQRPEQFETRLALLFPLQWFGYLSRLVARFEPYVLPEFDNVDLVRSTIAKLTLQHEHDFIQIVQPDEQAFLAPLFQEEALMAMRLRQLPLAAVAEGTVISRADFPAALLHPQFFTEVPIFFEPEFNLPRTLHFRQKDNVRLGLWGDRLAISSRDGAVIFPIFFVSLKESGDPSRAGYSIVTPVGSLVVQFNDKKKAQALMLQLAISVEQIAQDRGDRGALALQQSKDNFFRCLCTYLMPGAKVMKNRLMTIRAGKAEECFDAARGLVTEGISAPPLYFNAKARELTDDLAVFIPNRATCTG